MIVLSDSWPGAWALLSLAGALIFLLAYRKFREKRSIYVCVNTEPCDDGWKTNPYTAIEPLKFSWQDEEPIKIRPFKPRYHLTMALESCALSDLVLVDKTYLDRIRLRRHLIATHSDDVVAANPVANAAVDELYEWLFGTYLPARFPTIFKLSSEDRPKEKPSQLVNLVTAEKIPLQPHQSLTKSLEMIGSHIDNDFLILMHFPNPSNPSQPSTVLHAYVTCFPSGFSTLSKLGLKLADIHQPVPSYKQKLERSMDRFFATIERGKIVQRRNWTVTMTDELFLKSGAHGCGSNEGITDQAEKGGVRSSEQDDHAADEKTGNVDLRKARLRCERQTLHRLEKTGALVFGFKTYQYRLSEVKEEGSGEDLANAIEGLGKGNAPGMGPYKRSDVWGQEVTAFLRG
ncbi:hypothetical protein K402DRAFT_406731 [Aulographum hederae CBS 113979]|uniref:Uncharacterized protein n=1 Tax=Aulographum hederae CBS 113979 TaxID=1176131 RepID=A0A6G1GRY8_9PEZI|nr:hypothetical protein K402DRAFT_406731 [Aulographum hederae CBS 113979]